MDKDVEITGIYFYSYGRNFDEFFQFIAFDNRILYETRDKDILVSSNNTCAEYKNICDFF